ncbi:hypothetical protein E4U02_07685 [Microbacterium paludicola]|uniref:Uncharacterized protein n=1 Tax=Microbacterium paludicola TaxID=300019 RepID=A0A4Y9FUV1_9MICO|nr:hypothetical protein [Microbacterium paludicola]MBF0816289.1 hypothetical protein [Microbacterium paludicola]TFU33088.1 hypothetical protein E4U02_07685 [Microbacterium paludicola]
MTETTTTTGSGPVRLEGYVGQTELGQALGISSQKVGKLLVGLGLKDGKEPTPYALRIGASSEPMIGRHGADTCVYCLWKPEVVIPLLRKIL